jgi:hypothetical protein
MCLLSVCAERHRDQESGDLTAHACWERDPRPVRRSSCRTPRHRTDRPGPDPRRHPPTNEERESQLAIATAAIEYVASQRFVVSLGAVQLCVFGVGRVGPYRRRFFSWRSSARSMLRG